MSSDIQMRHSTLWADNGDALSKIYAGTGALKSSFTRHGKMSLAGALADARKSATRLYVNNFTDKARQKTIDLLLGRLANQVPVPLYDPINDMVSEELGRRAPEYSFTKSIRIWIGTFNVNGRNEGPDCDLTPWLFPESNQHYDDPTVFAVGFQEIVELSPQQIMSTDPSPRKVWEQSVSSCLNNRARSRGNGKYVLLRSGQLVGAALLIYVKEEALAEIKNVEGGVVKASPLTLTSYLPLPLCIMVTNLRRRACLALPAIKVDVLSDLTSQIPGYVSLLRILQLDLQIMMKETATMKPYGMASDFKKTGQ